MNIDKIAKWFTVTSGTDYAGLIAWLIFGLSFFLAFFVLIAHRWTTKPVAILFIALSAIVTYFISKYNVAIDTSMILNAAHTDVTEVRGLLSVHMLPYIFFLIVLPIFIVINTEITFHKPFRHVVTAVGTFALSLVIGIIFVYVNYNSIHTAANISNKYIINSLVPVNYIKSLGSFAQEAIVSADADKQPVPITGQVTKQQDLVVVLAIGETSRQKNFTLYGYIGNETNPELSKVKDLHVLNGKATIGTTIYALREILERDDIKLPAITSTLGIDTACYVNYKLYDNCNAVGEISATDCGHNGKCYDEDVIPLLENNLKTYQSGYRFVVLHFGGGSHGPDYTLRYPPEFQKFNPQCTDPDVMNQCTEKQLYNSFDNSILYVDYVVSKTIKTLEASGVPYVMIYLSDHGESLMEGGRIFHGMPPGISLPPEQAQIPLLVKSSVPIDVLQRDEYHQQDVFDSVLNLFSIQTDVLKQERGFINKKQ